MSHSDYATVSSYELSRLRQDASRLRALREDLPERIENAVRASRQEIEARMAPVENRQRELGQSVQNLSIDLRQTEQAIAERIGQQVKKTREAFQATAANIERQRRELRQELRETAKRLEQADAESEARLMEHVRVTEDKLRRLNEKTLQQMKEQEQRLKQAISSERLERQKSLKVANDRIDAIHQDRERLEEIARIRLQDAQSVREKIVSNIMHEHLLPNQLSRLESALASANNSLRLGAMEAALAQANTTFEDLSNLQDDLTRLENEWNNLRNLAFEDASRLLKEAQANRKMSEVEEKGEIAEVNYWTDGALAKLETELNIELNRIESENKPLSIAEMRELVETDLPKLDTRLDDILVEARLAVMSSQERCNIADSLMQSFEAGGWTVDDGTYKGEDMRDDFVAKAKNRAGDELVISVIRKGFENLVTIDSFETTPSAPGLLLERNKEVVVALQQQGMNTSETKCQSDVPSEANRDIEKVRQAKIRVAKR